MTYSIIVSIFINNIVILLVLISALPYMSFLAWPPLFLTHFCHWFWINHFYLLLSQVMPCDYFSFAVWLYIFPGVNICMIVFMEWFSINLVLHFPHVLILCQIPSNNVSRCPNILSNIIAPQPQLQPSARQLLVCFCSFLLIDIFVLFYKFYINGIIQCMLL